MTSSAASESSRPAPNTRPSKASRRSRTESRRATIAAPAPREPKPPWLKARIPSGERFEKLALHRTRASARDGLRGIDLPEHRRVLEQRHGDADVDGRGLHARLPVLRRRHRQSARLARPRGNPKLGAHRAAHEPEVRRADLGRSRRSCPTAVPRTTRPASARSRRRVPKPPSKRSRRTSPAISPTSKPSSRPGSTCSRKTSRRSKRLTSRVRDARAGYAQTLSVLAHAKRFRPKVLDEDEPDARARRNRGRDSRDARRPASASPSTS